MTTVKVLNAHRLGDGVAADVIIDNLVTVRGVTVDESPFTGRATARGPLRPYGDGRPILSWSDSVGTAIATAILAALNDSAAIAGPPDDEVTDPETCPACGGRWVSCGCDPATADAAYTGEAA